MTQRLMRAAVLVDVGRIEIRDIPVVAPKARDVCVRVVAVGICGTDFHIFQGHGNYNTDERGVPVPLAQHPQVLGHEIVGVVEECGPDVTDLRPGLRVVVDQGINCHSAGRPLCEYCASGDSHQCAAYQEHGITGLPGALAEFITVPAVNAIPVTASMPSALLALTEPLGCIVHSSDAVARAHTRYALEHGDRGRRVRTVLVSGAGPAGLLFIQYLRNALGWDGAILVAEPNAVKRSLAERFGAEALDPADNLVEAVRERTEGRRVEYLIDASGAGELFNQIPGLLRKQGTVLLYGHGHTGVDLSVMNNVQFLEPTLVSPVGASGGFLVDARPATYRRALDLIEHGIVDPGPIVTHRYTSLVAVADALGGAHRAPDYVKGVVELPQR
jgi:L-iditol 2-dehydrogenase